MGDVITFTLGDVLDAIEKNGLPQSRGYFFRESVDEDLGFGIEEKGIDSPSFLSHYRGKIKSACAIGQAAVNLGIYPKINTNDDTQLYEILSSIMIMNDTDNYTFKEIADNLRTRYPDLLNAPLNAFKFDYSPFLEESNVGTV